MAIKIYSLPREVPAPVIDYRNYDNAKVQIQEERHMTDLAAFLTKAGYTGKNTGQIYRESVADGYALYMVAEGVRSSFGLVHLPYGDAYQARNVSFLTKKEVLRRIEGEKRLQSLFRNKG